MLRIETILGSADSDAFADRLHALAHAQGLETVRLNAADVSRRRMRVTTDRGTDVAIALQRSERLHDGAVLVCEEGRAIVVRVDEIEWLPLEPADAAAAVELGYQAGNLHWRVRFSGSTLFVGLEGPVDTYLARLKPFLATGRIAVGTPVTGVEGTEPEPHSHTHHGAHHHRSARRSENPAHTHTSRSEEGACQAS